MLSILPPLGPIWNTVYELMAKISWKVFYLLNVGYNDPITSQFFLISRQFGCRDKCKMWADSIIIPKVKMILFIEDLDYELINHIWNGYANGGVHKKQLMEIPYMLSWNLSHRIILVERDVYTMHTMSTCIKYSFCRCHTHTHIYIYM